MLLSINISIFVLGVVFIVISVKNPEQENITFPVAMFLFVATGVMYLINFLAIDIKHVSYIKPTVITRTLHGVVLENDSLNPSSDLVKFYKMNDNELCIKKTIYTNNYDFNFQENFEVDKCE